MPIGWGVVDGKNESSTPQDIQVMTDAEFASPGIISGCEVERTTGLSYKVKQGACVVRMADGRKVVVPVHEQTVETSRIDSPRDEYVCLQQPPTEDASIYVGVDVPRHPHVVLDRFRYRLPARGTNEGTSIGQRDYAVRTAGTLGILTSWRSSAPFQEAVPKVLSHFGFDSFYVPTDRFVVLRLWCAFGTGIRRGNNEGDWGAYTWTVNVDNRPLYKTDAAYNGFNTVNAFEFPMVVSAGWHTIRVDAQYLAGAEAVNMGGGDSGRVATQWVLQDLGVSV